jgi:cytochrome P450
MLLFLAAGYSTTSTALVWFIFLMSKHPHVQNKLKKEISQYDVQHLSIEQLDSLIYLDSVLREVFRFVPPVIGTVRTLIADDQLPATGAHLSKGDQVMISFYNLNKDERFCEGSIHPDQFYPERFLIENNDNNNNLCATYATCYFR